MKHKNFVSMAALLILLISAMVLVTGCPTGATPPKDTGKVETPSNVNNTNNGNSPSGGNNNNTTPTPPVVTAEEFDLVGLLGKISLDSQVITSAPEIITISDLPASAEATSAVTSNNTDLIEYQSPNQLKIKKLPEATAEVKITVTLTKNGTSKSRDFIVKVFKAGEAPTTEDYIAVLSIPTTASDNFDLDDYLKDGTGIRWESKNNDIIRIEGSNQKAVVIPGLVEQKVKLTASAAGKTRDFEINVLPVVKIEDNYGEDKKVYEFKPGKITITYFKGGKLSKGSVYSYTNSNPADKKITVTLISTLSNNKWLTIEEYYTLKINEELNSIKNIDNLLNKNPITIADLKEVFKNFVPVDVSGYSDEDFYNEILLRFVNFGISYDDFIALDAAEQTKKLKTALEKLKEGLCMEFGLPPNSSTDEILAKAKEQLQQEANEEIKRAKKPCTYIYRIDKYWAGQLHFAAHQAYDPSKPWYENNEGYWHNPNSSPSENSWISHFNAGKAPNNSVTGFLIITTQSGVNTSDKHYNGSITGSGTNYIFTGSTQVSGNPNEQITATITNNDDTITVTVASPSLTATLKYRGKSLEIWRQ